MATRMLGKAPHATRAAPGWAVAARPAALAALSAGLLVASVLLASKAGGLPTVALAALAGGMAAAVCALAGAGRIRRLADLALDALAVGALAASASAAARVWGAPGTWSDLATLTPLGAGVACALYLGAVLWGLARRGRHPPLTGRLLLLALPYLANILLLLGSPHLTRELAASLAPAAGLPPVAELVLGRTLVLLLVNEVAILGLGLLIDRRWTGQVRLHGLALACSLLAALTPHLADLGSTAAAAGLPALPRTAAVVASTALAQAGLWAQTFFLTGLALDALRGRRPTTYAAVAHWGGGLKKGAVYGGLFILVVQAAALVASSPVALDVVAVAPILAATLGGALLFPLAKTVVESFDGSAPFHRRLVANQAEPWGHLRGAIVGAAVGLGLAVALPQAGDAARFAFGVLAGALAYAGVDLARDALAVRRGLRRRPQSWRVYFLGVALGGVAGGAVAWYLDAAQLDVVRQKFWAYAAVHYPAAGRPVVDYVIYPLFSKWGATSLGPVEGGVRLLYDEALSGVINWSLAAPLFGVNLVLLTALVRRSWAPLRDLVTAGGLVGVLEQTIRVLRWGLWMAPVVYSFLRMASDPSWYNQDGAVRTLVATGMAAWLPPDAFRAWSLELFLGLLAYEWLRVAIWFDHMGLRVATLVNLSFVGGDALDERAGRFLGHPGHARAIPEGIRRFATWAPLLIPFYIPRGAEWDRVWVEAEQLGASGRPLLPPVETLLHAYLALGAAALAVSGALYLRRRLAAPAPASPAPVAAAAPARPAAAAARREERFTLTNGIYTLELGADGRGYSRVLSAPRHGHEIDLTRRPDDPLQLRGKFLYLREPAGDGAGDSGAPWSLGAAPTGRAGPGYAVTRTGPTCLRLVNSRAGIRAEAHVEVSPDEPAETWRILLVNLEDRPRRLELTTYQEWALDGPDAYRRTPSFHAYHVGTRFVRALGAILANNTLLKDTARDPHKRRATGEVAFHAARADDDGPVRLVGYEDARQEFLGAGTAAGPAALAREDLRAPEDEGLLYTFDPVASLRLAVDLEPMGEAEVLIVDGYAENAHEAARRIARHLGTALPGEPDLRRAFALVRSHPDALRAPALEPPFAFSPDGAELRVGIGTPRPWTHVLANPLGQGAVVSNEGEVFSFCGNAQQNAFTPFALDTVPAQLPGSAVYVVDTGTGEVDTPAFAPHRRADATHEVAFGRGYATFTKRRPDGLDQELAVFVPPDLPAEIRLLRLRNRSSGPKRLRVVPYLQVVLAEVPHDSRGRLEVRADAENGALFYANHGNDFRRGWAFAGTSLAVECHETVRRRFVGGPGFDLANPHFALHGLPDPNEPDDGDRVAAFAGTVEIPPGCEALVAVVLGQAADRAEAARIVARFRDPAAAEAALAATKAWWEERLAVLRVETGLPAFDRLVNDWLPYQAMTARLWGRVGPNQRGGATGFRDQLQDVLPFVHLDPSIARRQILLHAGQQFVEGDVLQWWHASPDGGTGLGSRNRTSDTHVWLALVTARYVAATGDAGLLDEPAPFLEGVSIPRGSPGISFVPRPSLETGTVYEHCRRAVELALAARGRHGLPLMGIGDWNDGLSLVGERGRGESTWLGFLLHDALRGMADLAARRGDQAASRRYLDEAASLRTALEGARRGDTYVRAFTDDGGELTYADALTSSWPAISGAASPEVAREVAEAGLRRLERDHLVLLLDPPFVEGRGPSPGRIVDYPPGVRENGGQYSHGSSWLIDAFTRLAEQAVADRQPDLARQLNARAAEAWLKISPVGKHGPDCLAIYGLPPHQQPPDVSFGPGYEGRGGWAWYTGAAARMLSAAYGLMGIRMEDGELRVTGEPGGAAGPLGLRRVLHRGREVHAAPTAAGREAPAPER